MKCRFIELKAFSSQFSRCLEPNVLFSEWYDTLLENKDDNIDCNVSFFASVVTWL